MAEKEDTFFKKVAADLKSVRGAGGANKRSKAAIAWYRDKIGLTGRPSFGMIAKGKRNIEKPTPGQMFAFRYQSKLFEQGSLPWFDAAPLIISLGPNKHDNLLGLNLHYLPPAVRMRVLGFLMGEVGAKVLRHDTKLKVNYARVQAVSNLAPLQSAIKSYIPSRMQGKLVRVQPREWHHAVALPFAQFVGASARTVWQKTKR